MPLMRSLTSASFPREVRDRAAVALQRVGMLDKAWQPAGTLSGGQAQRVAIARAYCQQASVILADEPVSALDPRAADEVLALLADLAHGDGLAVLVVLHQPELATRYADRILGMKAGTLAFDKRPREVSAAGLLVAQCPRLRKPVHQRVVCPQGTDSRRVPALGAARPRRAVGRGQGGGHDAVHRGPEHRVRDRGLDRDAAAGRSQQRPVAAAV
jgi:ABC-type glutathione transport system ATPase component